jgi:RsiW-degrading membrane proteinase PrsW (M82 family)
MLLFLFSGCFTALFAVVAELAVFSFLTPSGMVMDPWHLGLVSGLSVIGFVTFIFVAIIEESLKFLVLSRQIRQALHDRLWISFLLFGLGFAATEVAFASITNETGLIPLFPMVGILTVHIFTSFLYGFAIANGKDRLKIVLVIGMSVHLLYDVVLALV